MAAKAVRDIPEVFTIPPEADLFSQRYPLLLFVIPGISGSK